MTKSHLKLVVDNGDAPLNPRNSLTKSKRNFNIGARAVLVIGGVASWAAIIGACQYAFSDASGVTDKDVSNEFSNTTVPISSTLDCK